MRDQPLQRRMPRRPPQQPLPLRLDRHEAPGRHRRARRVGRMEILYRDGPHARPPEHPGLPLLVRLDQHAPGDDGHGDGPRRAAAQQAEGAAAAEGEGGEAAGDGGDDEGGGVGAGGEEQGAGEARGGPRRRRRHVEGREPRGEAHVAEIRRRDVAERQGALSLRRSAPGGSPADQARPDCAAHDGQRQPRGSGKAGGGRARGLPPIVRRLPRGRARRRSGAGRSRGAPGRPGRTRPRRPRRRGAPPGPGPSPGPCRTGAC